MTAASQRCLTLLCLLVPATSACGEDDSASGSSDVAETTDLVEADVAPPDTASPDSASPDDETLADVVEETGDDGDSVQVDDSEPELQSPLICEIGSSGEGEGLYRDGVLVQACAEGERCSADQTRCTAARCFTADAGVDEGVYELDGDFPGELIELCAEGTRCDPDTPHCVPGVGPGLAVGFACDADDDCAGTESWAGRCIDAPGGFQMTQGRCGHGCSSSEDCGPGAHCAYLDSDDPVCVTDCPSFVECPADADCQDGDGDTLLECVPLGALPAEIATACVGPTECGGDPARAFCILDAFWTNGYCAVGGCRLDEDCPPDSHCGFFPSSGELGICIGDCGAGGSCLRPEHACSDLDFDGRTECVPQGFGPGGIGAPCQQLADCAGGADARCLADTQFGVAGGYCSEMCFSDESCPEGSICQGRGPAGNGSCLTACAGPDDCPAGQLCFDRDFDGRPECGPAGDGALAQNEPCGDRTECGTGPLGSCLAGANFPGYCSASCTSDAECGEDSHCAPIEGRGTGFCLPDCVEGDSCLAGASCIDFDGDGRLECAPTAGGSLPIGSRCMFGTDCAGGPGTFCGYPDLICTRFCSTHEDCGEGNRCVDDGSTGGIGLCRQSCRDASECGPFIACVDADADGSRECVVTGHGLTPLGGPCLGTPSCGRDQRLVCRLDAPGGVCTRACSDTLGCPAGSHCSPLGSGPAACLEDCVDDGDCGRDGWACFDTDADGVDECAPFGGGSRDVGDPCANVSDCAGGEDALCLRAPATFGSICSRACDDGVGCGEGASCVALPTVDDTVCVARCTDDDACRELYGCSDIDASPPGECVYGCTGDADCLFFRGVSRCDERGLCVP